jgi:hypothetical protein
MSLMKQLSRKLAQESPQSWHVYYNGVNVGSVSERSGNPNGTDSWKWSCGFYPGSSKNRTSGTATNFKEARTAFERAWESYLPGHTDEDFEANRRHVAFTTWKHAMWDAGCRMPTQNTSGRSRCFCGVEIGIDCQEHIYGNHMDMDR